MSDAEDKKKAEEAKKAEEKAKAEAEAKAKADAEAREEVAKAAAAVAQREKPRRLRRVGSANTVVAAVTASGGVARGRRTDA